MASFAPDSGQRVLGSVLTAEELAAFGAVPIRPPSDDPDSDAFGVALHDVQAGSLVSVAVDGLYARSDHHHVPAPRNAPVETCCHHCGGERWVGGGSRRGVRLPRCCYYCGTERRR